MLLAYSIYCLIYFHYKSIWTEPGYPEKVTVKVASSLASKSLPSDISDSASQTLKKLLSQRGKSYLTLIHGDKANRSATANRVCVKCPNQPIKPLRTHHCRVCRRDVMLMDHHCRKIHSFSCANVNSLD